MIVSSATTGKLFFSGGDGSSYAVVSHLIGIASALYLVLSHHSGRHVSKLCWIRSDNTLVNVYVEVCQE